MAVSDNIWNEIAGSFKEGNKLYDTYQQNRKATEAAERAKYGIDQRNANLENLRQSVYNTTKVLNELPDNVTNRVRGRLVTNAQRSRILANEQDPLARQVANLSGTRDVEQQGLNQVQGLIDGVLRGITEDYGNRRQLLSDRRGGLVTRYTSELEKESQASQRALQERLAAIQAQAVRDQAQMQLRAQQLAMEQQDRLRREMARDNAMAVVSPSAAASTSGVRKSSSPIIDSFSQAAQRNFGQAQQQMSSNDWGRDFQNRTGDFLNSLFGGNRFNGYYNDPVR